MIIRVLAYTLFDLFSKIIINYLVDINNSYVVIDNFFRITHVRNTGAAWSIMSGKTVLLVIISLLIIVGLIGYIVRNPAKDRLEKNGYAMILGGSIGNFVERLFLGYVTDFLDFNIWGYNYPIFNIADCLIVVGIVLLIISTWRCKK